MPDYSNYNARAYNKYGEIWRNTGKCVFCDLKDKYIVTKIDSVVLTVNIFPYIDGHLLIIPRRHIEAYSEMNDTETKAIKELAVLGEKLIQKVYKHKDIWFMYRMAKGFTGQKTVPHVHAHLIPFSAQLFKWEFQKISVPPEESAQKFRDSL